MVTRPFKFADGGGNRSAGAEGQEGMTREICKGCGRINPLGFRVPDEIWKRAAGPNVDNVLCIMCFAQRADDAGLPWDLDIQFFPVSLRTHAEQGF